MMKKKLLTLESFLNQIQNNFENVSKSKEVRGTRYILNKQAFLIVAKSPFWEDINSFDTYEMKIHSNALLIIFLILLDLK